MSGTQAIQQLVDVDGDIWLQERPKIAEKVNTARAKVDEMSDFGKLVIYDTQLEFNIISSNKQPSLFLIDKNCLSAELQERRNTVFPKLAMALD